MSAAEIAWLAGLFEGEGCISPNGRSVTLTLAMTDRDVIDRVHAVTGAGAVYVDKARPNRKTCYRWQVGNRKAVARILLAIYPMLGARRRERIAEAVTRWDRPLTGRWSIA